MTAPRVVALLGLPRTGKSTYLGALWQIIQDPQRTEIVEEDVRGDRGYVDELGIQVAKASEIQRTEVDSREGLMITVRTEADGVVSLEIPDLSGESARQLVEDRVWRATLDEAVENADALIMFVHPQRIDAPVPISFATAALGAAQEPAPVERDSGARTDANQLTSNAEVPVFVPKKACTAAKLVELLENILETVEPPRRLSIAVVISAWDVASAGRTPAEWLAENLPGVGDMLATNEDLVRFAVFGVSAQGGKLPEQQDELLARGDVAQRVYAADGHGEAVSLVEPLSWAIRA